MAKIKFGKDDSYDNVKKTLQEALKDKYSFLSKKYPPIFRAVLHGEMKPELLQMMLNQRDKINSEIRIKFQLFE